VSLTASDVRPVATSTEILEALFSKWPADKHAHVYEAAQNAQQNGRKIDACVIGLWASTGNMIDAVEVKVSASDLKRELDNPDKANWWFDHSHRFWIAAPIALAKAKIDLIPVTWGVLGVDVGGVVKTLRQAPQREARPLPVTTWAGLVRNSSGAGAAALQRQWDVGYQAGVKRAQEDAARVADRLPVDSYEMQRWKAAYEREQLLQRADENGWNGDRLARIAEALGPYGTPSDLRAIVKGLNSQTAVVAGALRRYAEILALELPAIGADS
jgi:hypothetical protein